MTSPTTELSPDEGFALQARLLCIPIEGIGDGQVDTIFFRLGHRTLRECVMPVDSSAKRNTSRRGCSSKQLATGNPELWHGMFRFAFHQPAVATFSAICESGSCSA